MMVLMATCFASDGHCEHEMSIFSEPEGSPELFFSKQPSDIRYLEQLFHKDEDLYVIFMVRDPRAVIASIHTAAADMYFCNFRVWKECMDPARRLMEHPRFIRVRYEDLTRDPDAVQADIVARFPFLTAQYPFSGYQTVARPSREALNAMSGLRAISTSRITGWYDHLPRIKEQLQHYPEMTAALVENGYEADDAWLEMLTSVEARTFPCRYPDREPVLKRLETRFRKWLQTRRYLARHHLS
jgi:hypothetical protein